MEGTAQGVSVTGANVAANGQGEKWWLPERVLWFKPADADLDLARQHIPELEAGDWLAVNTQPAELDDLRGQLVVDWILPYRTGEVLVATAAGPKSVTVSGRKGTHRRRWVYLQERLFPVVGLCMVARPGRFDLQRVVN